MLFLTRAVEQPVLDCVMIRSAYICRSSQSRRKLAMEHLYNEIEHKTAAPEEHHAAANAAFSNEAIAEFGRGGGHGGGHGGGWDHGGDHGGGRRPWPGPDRGWCRWEPFPW